MDTKVETLYKKNDSVKFFHPLYGSAILEGTVLSCEHVEGMGMLVNVFVMTNSVGLIQIHERFLARLEIPQVGAYGSF